MLAPVPETTPQEVAPDTYLIPHLAPAGDGVYVPMNSMLITGREPVIVDTGVEIFRESWLAKVRSLVELEDVRWIFISHDDHDHVGNLAPLLELCPAATVVANFFIAERMSIEPHPIPYERMAWLEDGDTFRAGDRTLRLFVPPIYDGVTTRGLFDESTGAMWTVDAFGSLAPGAVHRVDEIPAELYDESFALFSSLISPWREWLDPDVYGRHVDRVEELGPLAIASAHGPILTGESIPDAYDRVRRYAGTSRMTPPGPEVLDQIVQQAADALAHGAVAPATGEPGEPALL